MSDERLLHNSRSEVTHLYFNVLRRERQAVQRERGAAREALRRERERTARAVGEYKRAFDHARAEAAEYQAILAKAKRDGQQLMRILEYLDKQAA